MISKRMYASAACFFALIALPAHGQVNRATLTGTVTDETGAAIAAATVVAEAPATGFRRETTSSPTGVYHLPALPVGNYSVVVSKAGFSPANIENVVLMVGSARTMDVQLRVGGIATQVEVVANATPLDETSGEIGSVITEQQIRNIPLNGRQWASLMMLAPGAVNVGEGNQNSVRFFGRARDDNNWTFDGVDATGVKDPRQEGNLRLVISTDAIAEFRVNSLPFTAESGFGGGAQVNLVSRVGTNAFHGSVFEFLRNSYFDARRPFDGPEPPPFRLNQFGANLGGPVIRNRTFFFANYEGLVQRLSITRADGLVPSASFRARTPAALRSIVDAFPMGTERVNDDVDRLFATTPERRNEHSGMLRVDHQFSDRHNLFARYSTTDGFIGEIRNGLFERRDFYLKPSNFTTQWQQLWRPTLINEIKLGINRSALRRPQVGLIPEGITIPGFTTTLATTFIVENPTSYSLLDNLSWIKGRHTIKTGFELRRIHLNVGNGPQTTVRFASADAFLRNAVDRVQVSGELPSVGGRRWMAGGFLQDEIRLSSELTVNLGLRYEYYTVMTEEYGRGLVFDLERCQGFCAEGTPWYFADRDNIAPRVSFAYSPALLGGRTVFRGGYGRYFGPGQQDDITAALDSIPETLQLSAADAPGLTYPVGSFLGQLRSQGLTPRAVQRDRQEPEAHQWTFSIQQELPRDFVGQAAYVGSVGRHQFSRTYVNVLDPVTRQRPLRQFNQIDQKRYDGNSNFHGLQGSLQRHFSRGWMWQAQYMWSHAITDNSGSGEGAQIMNTSCRACDRGSTDFDIRHTATVNSVYQLPFGTGRAYANSLSGFAGWLASGWDVSGLFAARTGRPFSVLVDRSSGAVPTGQTQNQRPDLVAGVNPYASVKGPQQWLNPAAFAVPASGGFGNLGRNALRGPALWQLDTALTKRTRLTEGSSLDFRFEVFNLFNRAQYGEPVANFSNPNFGRILATANDGATGTGTSRQLQFMLRLSF